MRDKKTNSHQQEIPIVKEPAPDEDLLKTSGTDARSDSKASKLKKFEVEAKSEILDHANKNNAYTQEDVSDLIFKYAEKASDTVRLILQNRSFDCTEENVIKFKVGSNYERENLLNESALLEFLRHHLHNIKIVFGFETDVKLMEGMQAKKPLTSEEKFNILKEKNPLVQTLFDRLKLKIND